MQNRPARHHFLPKYLMKRFSFETRKSSGRSPTYFVYYFRKGVAPVPCNTINVGVVRQFHGESGTLESAMAEEENTHDRYVQDLLESRAMTNELQVAAGAIVSNLMMRTRNLRESMRRIGTAVIGGISTAADSGRLHTVMTTALASSPWLLSESIENAIREVPLFADHSALALGFVRSLELAIVRNQDGYFRRFGSAFTPDIVEALQKLDLKAMLDRGHVQAMGKLLSQAPHVAFTSALHWRIIRYRPGELILGDAGPVAKDGHEDWKQAWYLGPTAVTVALPIAHDCLLMGSRDRDAMAPEADNLNRAAARTSSEFFIARQDTDREREYQTLIARDAAFFSPEETAALLTGLVDSPGSTPSEAGTRSTGECQRLVLEDVRVDGLDAERTERARGMVRATLGSLAETGGELELPVPVELRVWISPDLASSLNEAHRLLGLVPPTTMTAGLAATFSGLTLTAGPRSRVIAVIILPSRDWEDVSGRALTVAVFEMLRQFVGLVRDVRAGERHRPPPIKTWGELLHSWSRRFCRTSAVTRAAADITRSILHPRREDGHAVAVGDLLGEGNCDSSEFLLDRIEPLISEAVAVRTRGDQVSPTQLWSVVDAFGQILESLACMAGLLEAEGGHEAIQARIASSPRFLRYVSPEWDKIRFASGGAVTGADLPALAHHLKVVLGRLGAWITSDSKTGWYLFASNPTDSATFDSLYSKGEELGSLGAKLLETTHGLHESGDARDGTNPVNSE